VVGAIAGDALGAMGDLVGLLIVGEIVEDLLGEPVGDPVGELVVYLLGDPVGDPVGDLVGDLLGVARGEIVGGPVSGFSPTSKNSILTSNDSFCSLL